MKNNLVFNSSEFKNAFPNKVRFETFKSLFNTIIKWIDEHPEDDFFNSNFNKLFIMNPTYLMCRDKHCKLMQNDIDVELLQYHDLFLPNIYALWFLSLWSQWLPENRAKERVLDYACGVGVFMRYADHLGYDVFGYDSWDATPKALAENFLKNFGLDRRLINNYEDIFSGLKDTTILSVMGWYVKDQRFYEIPTLKFLLLDAKYACHPTESVPVPTDKFEICFQNEVIKIYSKI